MTTFDSSRFESGTKICSDIGAMVEKVTHGVDGLHFRAGDPRSLADAMREAQIVVERAMYWPGGFFAANRGYEYPLTLLAMAFALLIAGGGQASVDRALSGGRR